MAIATMGFANDTFTIKEQSLIDKQIKTAVIKKFTPQYLKQIEKNAASKYLLVKVGGKFTANSGGRHFTGTIRSINKLTVRVGDFLINKKDYPDYYFDKIVNDRMRNAYINKYYHHAKNSYRQRAGIFYRNKILAKRPVSEQPVVIARQEPIKKPQQPISRPSTQTIVNKPVTTNRTQEMTFRRPVKRKIVTQKKNPITSRYVPAPVDPKEPENLIDKYVHYFGGKWCDKFYGHSEYTFDKNTITYKKFGKPVIHHITSIKRLKGNFKFNSFNQNFVITTGIRKPIHWILHYQIIKTKISNSSNGQSYISTDELIYFYLDGMKDTIEIAREQVGVKRPPQESPKEMQAAFQKYICDTWISGQDTYMVSKESITYQRFDAPVVWKITNFARLKNDESKPTNWYQYFVITATSGKRTIHFLLNWGNDIHGGTLFLNIEGSKSRSVLLTRKKKWNAQNYRR